MLGGSCCMSVLGGSKRPLLTGTMLCSSSPCTVSVPAAGGQQPCGGKASGHSNVDVVVVSKLELKPART